MPSGARYALVFSVLVIICALALPLGRSESHSPSVAPPPRQSVAPEAAPVETEAFVGVVLPAEAVEVTSTLTGQILAITGRAGSYVGHQDVIARIRTVAVTEADIAVARADLAATEAELGRLEIEAAQTQERLRRAEALNKQELISAEQFTDAQYQDRVARARVTAADGAVARHRTVLEQRRALFRETEVRAPFTGVIARRYVDRGASVNVGTAIVRVIRTEQLRVRFGVPSADAMRVRVGLPISARISETNTMLSGSIETVAPEVESASQMLVVEALVSPPPGRHSEGMLFAGRRAEVRLRPMSASSVR